TANRLPGVPVSSVALWFPRPAILMPALDHLAGLFYADLAQLGTFEEVLVENTPEPYRKLLAHHEHMTVAVERHHGSPVDVEVLAAKRDGEFYSRKIVLHR